jgi:hypothetical protein
MAPIEMQDRPLVVAPVKKQDNGRNKREKKHTEIQDVTLTKDVYDGLVKLIIAPGARGTKLEQIDRLEASLAEIRELRLLMVGGNETGEVALVLVLGMPLRLRDALKSMPLISDAVCSGEDILLSLK